MPARRLIRHARPVSAARTHTRARPHARTLPACRAEALEPRTLLTLVAPIDLQAAQSTSLSVSLSWQASPSSFSTYDVQRKAGPTGAWETIASVPQGTDTYADVNDASPVSAGTEYFYRVRANASGADFSPWSNETDFRPWGSNNVGLATTGSASQSGAAYTVSGNSDLAGQEDGFRFLYKTFNGSGEVVAKVDSQAQVQPNGWDKAAVLFRAGTTSGTDKYAATYITPAQGHLQQWRDAWWQLAWRTGGAAPQWVRIVRAYDPGTGSSTFTGYTSANPTSGWGSAITTVSLPGLPATMYVGLGVASGGMTQASTANFSKVDFGLPATPSGLSGVPTGGTVNLAWSDNSSIESGYVVERSSDGIQYNTIATLGPNSTSHADAGAAGGTYRYRVRATHAAGNSSPSGIAVVTAPPAGDGLVAVYYNNPDLTGTSATRVDGAVDFTFSAANLPAGITPDTFSAAWSGRIQPRYSETYTFRTEADDGVRLWVNDQLVVNHWPTPIPGDANLDGSVNFVDFQILEVNFGAGTEWEQGDFDDDDDVDNDDFNALYDHFGEVEPTVHTGTIALAANQTYNIRLEYFDRKGSAFARLLWQSASQALEVVPTGRLFSTGNSSVAPPPVASMSATAPSATQVNLSWIDVAGESLYVVQRSEDGARFTDIGQAPANASSFTDTVGGIGKWYMYRVLASGAGGRSAPGATTASTAALHDMLDTTFFDSGGLNRSMANADGRIEKAYIAYHGEHAYGILPEREDLVRARANDAANAYGPSAWFITDLEGAEWEVDIRNRSKADVEAAITKFVNVFDWAADEQPGLRMGMYGILPLPGPVSQTPAHVAAWEEAQAFVRGIRDGVSRPQFDLVKRLDGIFPVFYTSVLDVTDWAPMAVTGSIAAHGYGKPVYPFLWMNFHEFTRYVPNHVIPDDFWRAQLDTVGQYGGGSTIWGGGTPFDPSAGWWQETEAFLNQAPLAPMAPPVLSLTTPGARLNWTDTSAEQLYLVEHSLDGISWDVRGATVRNNHAWSERRIKPGSHHYYRVRAVNASGTALSNVVEVTNAQRDAFSINEAETYDLADYWEYPNGPLDDSGSFLRSPFSGGGEWAKFSQVNFGGTGANQFTMSTGMGDNSTRRFDIYIDGLPGSGTKIGTIAPGRIVRYAYWEPQSVPVSLTTGVHDVYFYAVAGGGGPPVMDWFNFGYNAAPAAPGYVRTASLPNGIRIDWDSYSADATSFVVERATDPGDLLVPGSGNWEPISTPPIPTGTTTFTDTTVAPGAHHFYRVRAQNAHGSNVSFERVEGWTRTTRPDARIEAESLDQYDPLLMQVTATNITGVNFAGWARYSGVDFGSGRSTISVGLTPVYGGWLAVYDGTRGGTLIALIDVSNASGPISLLTQLQGVHDIFVVFGGSFAPATLDWLEFN